MEMIKKIYLKQYIFDNRIAHINAENVVYALHFIDCNNDYRAGIVVEQMLLKRYNKAVSVE